MTNRKDRRAAQAKTKAEPTKVAVIKCPNLRTAMLNLEDAMRHGFRDGMAKMPKGLEPHEQFVDVMLMGVVRFPAVGFEPATPDGAAGELNKAMHEAFGMAHGLDETLGYNSEAETIRTLANALGIIKRAVETFKEASANIRDEDHDEYISAVYPLVRALSECFP